MRVITEHRCSKRHRSTRSFARCVWPNATEIRGHGFLALVVTCHDDPRILLADRLRWAHVLEAEIAVFGCGAAICTREHELVALDIDGPVSDLAPAVRLAVA